MSEAVTAGAGSKIALAWMTMTYRCGTCGREETVYLEEGLEGGPRPEHGGRNHMPVPFGIVCDHCITPENRGKVAYPFGLMKHVRWNADKTLMPSQAVPPGARYFRRPSRAEERDRRYRERSKGCA